MATLTAFYPRLAWGGNVLDFVDAVTTIKASDKRIGGQNITISGIAETLTERFETVIFVGWKFMRATDVNLLWSYWRTWGGYGKEATLILDRLYTAAGQSEYDRFNTFFSRAILLNDPFAPERSVLARALYQIELVFRQNGG